MRLLHKRLLTNYESTTLCWSTAALVNTQAAALKVAWPWGGALADGFAIAQMTAPEKLRGTHCKQIGGDTKDSSALGQLWAQQNTAVFSVLTNLLARTSSQLFKWLSSCPLDGIPSLQCVTAPHILVLKSDVFKNILSFMSHPKDRALLGSWFLAPWNCIKCPLRSS